jgi:hypothetical protein
MFEDTVDECIRCRRVAPDPASMEFLDWDPVGDDAESLICPNCLTDSEEAMGRVTLAEDVDIAHSLWYV